MTKTTLNFFLKCCLLLLSFCGHSQNSNSQKKFNPIPHEDHELIQNRTKYSQTFLNPNQTKTTVQSSVPLHYQTNDGSWQRIDYQFSQSKDQLVYPIQNPFFEQNAKHTAITVANQRIKMANQTQFTFFSNQAVVRKTNTSNQPAVLANDSEIVFKNIAPKVDKNVTLYHQAMKYNYQINDAAFFPEQFDYMLVEDLIDLPNGFSIRSEEAQNRLMIIDPKGKEALVFHEPIISDSQTSVRNLRPQPYEAKYQLIKINDHRYKIQIRIEASWLHSNERVFPINIDPVVTVNDNEVVNSCFFPNYQQATLQVAVPAGETVLFSNISYDFVALAGSGAWMSDQRSFVSGPNGQTPVMNGVGGDEGLYTYNLNESPIGNVVSTGQIDFTFNFSRNWGGSGCSAAFNFVNRRQVAVTYGSIDFGDGPLVINEYSASNRNFNDGFDRNEDWIELYNASPDTYFNLAGYHLSNNINNPTKWQIQNGVIPPNSRVVVFCSNRDISSGTVLHASFDLTQTGSPDEIVLADPGGTIIDSHEMFVTQTNHSYGRTTDGASTWSVFEDVTPGQSNINGFSNYTSKPTFNLAPGKYPGTINVTLATSGTNEQIRYTTNGSTPTETSALYAGPISIAQSMVVRARTFSTTPGRLPGFIETNTYFINEIFAVDFIAVLD